MPSNSTTAVTALQAGHSQTAAAQALITLNCQLTWRVQLGKLLGRSQGGSVAQW